jgi:hypothetical protein
LDECELWLVASAPPQPGEFVQLGIVFADAKYWASPRARVLMNIVMAGISQALKRRFEGVKFAVSRPVAI